ncbi:MAG: adenylate/guanylate cyclase domain-containing protein [Leptospirales bacterium]
MIKRIRKKVIGISRGATRRPESLDVAETPGESPDSPKLAAESGALPAAVPAQPKSASLPQPSAPSEGEASGQIQFRLSKFTIKVKLLTIISAIIIVSMSLMIFLATRSFLNDSIKRVQENNLNLAEVIGLKAEADFRIAVSNAELLIGSKDEGFTTRFFEKNPGIFFIGLATGAADRGLQFDRAYYNQSFLNRNSLTVANVEELHALHGASFAGVFSGATIVENISPGFAVPALATGRPLEPAVAGGLEGGAEAAADAGVLIIYLDAEAFLKAFAGNENSLTTTFMVNSAGDVIAHPDGDLMLSRANLSESKIVSTLLESKVQLGQADYSENETEYLGSYRRLSFAGLGVVSTVKREEALAAVYQIRNQNLLLLIILLNVALLVVYFYARSMSIPIVRLASATREIEQGQYDIELRPRSRDEVGLLTASFVNMARGLGERERMKDAFGRFVNKEIAERAMRGELQLGGERKTGAVFFSDLRGFTALSEGMEPEEVVVYLNHYFTAMVSCVNRTGGTVDKFIGDAIMAHWNTLTPVENASEQAINAGLHMRTALMEFNAQGFGPTAKMGSGINTGPVIAGQIGSEERLEFTVIGDAVNLASRIEALNKPFRTDLLISQDTYDDVRDIFRVEHMPAIKVKGKSQPQTVYAVLGRFDDPDAPTTIGQLRDLLGIPDDPNADSKQPAVVEDGGEVKYEVLDTPPKPPAPDAQAAPAREPEAVSGDSASSSVASPSKPPAPGDSGSRAGW